MAVDPQSKGKILFSLRLNIVPNALRTYNLLASLKPADEEGRERFIQWAKDEKSGVFPKDTREPVDAQEAIQDVWVWLLASGMAFGERISNNLSENGLRCQYENPIDGKCWIQTYSIGEDEFIVHQF